MILLSLIAYQDFKDRLVSWYLFPLLFGFLAYKGIRHLLVVEFLEYAVVNLAFLILQFAMGTIYVSIKQRQLVNITKQWIGWGDVLFLVALCVAFSPLNFFVFYLASLIGVIGIALIQKVFTKNEEPLIPLAGIMAVFMVIILGLNLSVFPINLFDDSYFANLLIGM